MWNVNFTGEKKAEWTKKFHPSIEVTRICSDKRKSSRMSSSTMTRLTEKCSVPKFCASSAEPRSSWTQRILTPKLHRNSRTRPFSLPCKTGLFINFARTARFPEKRNHGYVVSELFEIHRRLAVTLASCQPTTNGGVYGACILKAACSRSICSLFVYKWFRLV